jgi:hypothetical protein
MERAGITGEVAHTAVEDALVVVRLVRGTFGFGEPIFPEQPADDGLVLDVVRRPATARGVAQQLSSDFLARGQFAAQ